MLKGEVNLIKLLIMIYNLQVARACYWVTLLKVIDLIETGIFVLRKKNNQITFLHVYHHITTVLTALISLRYIATGMAVFYPATNCSVHVIMYTYYLLSSIKGINKIVHPFKKYITIIQMVSNNTNSNFYFETTSLKSIRFINDHY